MAEPSKLESNIMDVDLASARTWLENEAKTSGGAICPCCETKQKARGKKPTPAQCALLVVMYNNYQVGQIVPVDGVVNALPNIEGLKAAGFENLTHWDLVEPTPEHPGHVRLCDGGYFFVHKEFAITPRAWILNDRVVARDGKPTKLVKLLGDKYDLNTLLSVKFG